MKIIGKTDKGYIVEVSDFEIARIEGCNSFDSDYDRRKKIGDVVNVHALWDAMLFVRLTARNLTNVVTEAAKVFSKVLEEPVVEAPQPYVQEDSR